MYGDLSFIVESYQVLASCALFPLFSFLQSSCFSLFIFGLFRFLEVLALFELLGFLKVICMLEVLCLLEVLG